MFLEREPSTDHKQLEAAAWEFSKEAVGIIKG
jgi:hypothetical protein